MSRFFDINIYFLYCITNFFKIDPIKFFIEKLYSFMFEIVPPPLS